MEKEQQTAPDFQAQVKEIPGTVIEVITRPADFFRRLPRTGGFLPPLIFMVVLGTFSGLITSLLALAGLGPAGGLATGLAAVILMPVMVAIFGFIGAAVLFAIWKIMGSRESFETVYRGMAYTAAIMPVTTVLNLIPYLGSIIGLAWMTFLLVVISIEVHAIKAKTAWAGFGAICAIFALISLSAEVASRKMARHTQAWQQESLVELDRLQEMTPEEAGRVMGDFLRGLQQAAGDRK
jgi:hypothetical protein